MSRLAAASDGVIPERFVYFRVYLKSNFELLNVSERSLFDYGFRSRANSERFRTLDILKRGMYKNIRAECSHRV